MPNSNDYSVVLLIFYLVFRHVVIFTRQDEFQHVMCHLNLKIMRYKIARLPRKTRSHKTCEIKQI